MIRNLRTLAVAILALAATAAVAAPNASATSFHSASAHTAYVATQTSNHVFTTAAMTVTCIKVVGDATTSTTTNTEITATGIVYTECTAKTIFGIIAVTVNFNGCDYKFTSEEGQPIHVECPSGKTISIAGPGCTVTVPAQTISSASYENVVEKAPGHVELDVAASGITSTATGAFCSATGTFTTGTYTGSATIRGTNTAGEQVKIWWE